MHETISFVFEPRKGVGIDIGRNVLYLESVGSKGITSCTPLFTAPWSCSVRGPPHSGVHEALPFALKRPGAGNSGMFVLEPRKGGRNRHRPECFQRSLPVSAVDLGVSQVCAAADANFDDLSRRYVLSRSQGRIQTQVSYATKM